MYPGLGGQVPRLTSCPSPERNGAGGQGRASRGCQDLQGYLGGGRDQCGKEDRQQYGNEQKKARGLRKRWIKDTQYTITLLDYETGKQKERISFRTDR